MRKGKSPPSLCGISRRRLSAPYRSISPEPWARCGSTRHKGLITHKFADLRRSRNVNMKYENEDGGNKSDVRGSVGSFMKASIIVLDGLLCLVAAVESHFALSSLSPSHVSPRLSSATRSISLFHSFRLPLARSHPCPFPLCPHRRRRRKHPRDSHANLVLSRRKGTLSCLL